MIQTRTVSPDVVAHDVVPRGVPPRAVVSYAGQHPATPESVPAQTVSAPRGRLRDVSADPDLQVSVREDAGRCRITVSGELDGQTAPLLTGVVESQVEQHHVDLQIDVAGMTFVDLRGVYALMAARRRVRARGGRLLVLHPSPLLARMVQLCGVEDMLERPSGSPASGR